MKVIPIWYVKNKRLTACHVRNSIPLCSHSRPSSRIFSERNYLAPVSGSIDVGYLSKRGANESIGVSPSKTTNTNEEHTQVYSSLTKQRHAESACHVCFFQCATSANLQMREKQQLFSSIEAVYRSFPVESFWGKSSANRSSWSKSYEILGLFLLAYHRIPSFLERGHRGLWWNVWFVFFLSTCQFIGEIVFVSFGHLFPEAFSLLPIWPKSLAAVSFASVAWLCLWIQQGRLEGIHILTWPLLQHITT